MHYEKKWTKDTRHYIDKQTESYMKTQIHNLVDSHFKQHIFTKLGKWIGTNVTQNELCEIVEKTIYDYLIILKQRWIAAQGQAGNLPLGDILPKRSN